MIQSKLNPRVLDETEDLLLGHDFECVYLIDKKKNTSLYLGNIYGDPVFGLISKSNDWCLVGGSRSLLWKKGNPVIEIDVSELSWVIKGRQVSDMGVELLVDPWSKKGAVWRLDIDSLQKQKLRDYRLDNEYTEDYEW